jgi:hypothetical protein
LQYYRQLAAILFLVAGIPARGDEVRNVHLLSPQGGGRRCSGTALITRVCPLGDCTEAAEERVPFLADTVVAVKEKQGTPTSRIEFESHDCWIAPISKPDAAGSLHSTAWPLVTVRGTLSLSDGKVAPALHAVVTVEGNDEVLEQCSVRSNKWECPIPATRVTIRLTVPGYAPRHVWGIDGLVEESRRVGLLEFRRGATIIGSLRGPTRVLPTDIRIDLVNDGSRLTEPYARSRAKDGKFEFTGLPPGPYRIIVRSRGLSPVESQRVTITTASLYDAGVLRLQELAALKVHVTPPSDDLQRPWHVIIDRVSPGSPYTTRISDEPVKADGGWETHALEAGVYRIAVANATGVLDRRRIIVDATTPPVEIHLNLIEVRGRLKTASEGMPAKLTFTSTGLNSGKRISTKSDEEGNFKTALPSEGQWDVLVELLTRHAYVVRHGVEIHKRFDAPYAEIDLCLPSGTIKGIVVDSKGEPVQKPLDVMLSRDGRVEADAGSDESGAFTFFGLPDGTVTLRARSPSIGDSGFVPVEINGEAESTTKLVLTAARTIKGVTVTSDGYPVAGALIRYAEGSSGYGETVAGPGGMFELSVPAQTEDTTVIVLATGMPVCLARLRTTDDSQPQQVTLAPTAGTLVIPMSANSRRPMIGLPGGSMFGIIALIYPPDGSSPLPQGVSPGGFAIALQPGLYQVCPVANSCEGIMIREGEKTTVKPSSPDDGDKRPVK